MPLRLLLCCLFLSAVLPAQQATNERVLARAALAQKTIDIGDQIWLEVNISAPPATQVSALPADFLNAAEGLEVIDAKPLSTVAESPELLLQQRFLITSFDTGYIVVPRLPYTYLAADGGRDTAFTEDLLLRVRAVPVGDDNELRPIKPIIEEPLNVFDFWPLFLFLAVAGVGYLVYRQRQRRQRATPPPPPPPPADVIALTQLKALEARELWQAGQTKEYYSELTRILREYLESRFGVAAMEMTTRQITAELGRREELDGVQGHELGELLQLSDLVKFAQATPAAELHPRSLERVRNFVQTTGRPTPSPVSPPPATQEPSPLPPSGGRGGATTQTEQEI
ncbi:hypothetical protein QWY85_03290 [Neolewinella lacunae]|uniref:Protein BatD n=1 Tax=Neolewinella lacunae TaxID=1517758 RepID=A0A923PLR0_9BACT|nr:hypothetical protein [Neolewinella lacunae]MBC6996392.1 hypothetical protein [Neolewinella lacunae]MDN3633665.1 hypothetical protein [Neolewinella lacunae]